MIFATVPLAAAEGSLLAHSCATASGRISKGTQIGPDEIAAMRAAGLEDVTVARLEAGDVEENAAAEALASALLHDPAAQGLRMSAAGTGRVNLFATGPGVLMLDPGRIDRMNAIDPMISLATLGPFARVEPGTMAATIKIISYAVPEAALKAVLALAGDALRVAPPVVKRAVLLETQVGTGPLSEKGLKSTRTRLDRLGVDLLDREILPHETQALARAIAGATGDIILILTGSATSDPNDVAPEALRRAGGMSRPMECPSTLATFCFSAIWMGAL